MRKIPALMAIAILIAGHTYAQEQPKEASDAAKQDTVAPYKKYPTLPAFNILAMDSTTIFNTFNIPKGRKTAIVFFSPDCGHCRRLVTRITDSMDVLQAFDFYFVTPVHNMEEIRKFYKQHHLGDYSNVKMVGRDTEFFFGSFYKVRMVPDIVLYDEQKKLIKMLEGEAPVREMQLVAQ